MITSSNNISLNSAQQKDKFVVVGGKDNLVIDSRGKVYPMGGVAPSAAPSAEVITGGGSLTPNIGYSYAYTYFNEYQDSETEPSPASAYIGREDEGKYMTTKIVGKVVYVSGADLRKEDDYYNGQTIACEIVNDEYVNVYSQWQYRSVVDYEYDNVNDLGKFTINREFFNVDPDEADQKYQLKIEDLESETGIVGGKSKGSNKLVLDPSSAQTPADYRFKTIHIISGKGKGQKRIIVDATQREDGLIEITVDAPWKQKPKYVDDTTKDLATLREQAEKQKGTKRAKNFYNQYYSSEYVISDPLRYNGYAIDANVISYDDKGRRVKLSGLGHGGDLLTGQVVSYKDSISSERDKITIVLDGDDDTTSAADDIATYTNKRIRIYDGAGAGLDARINSVSKATDKRITFTIDVYGKMKKKDIPNASSKCVIYAGESVSSSMVYRYTENQHTKTSVIYPRVFYSEKNGDNTELVCLGYNGYIDSPYLCATEAANAETYNNGKCYIMFKVKDKFDRKYYISRPILYANLVEKTEKDQKTGAERTYQQLRIGVNDLPKVDGKEVEVYKKNNYNPADTSEGGENNTDYFVYSDNLQDGYYTGWIAAFYNTSDTFSKGKKKVRTSRVAGYLDATGELLLCNGVPGVGEGWQCVLYTEYTKHIGSRVKVYQEDSYNPNYTSKTNSRYFLLDYFASSINDYYKDWKFEFLYGTAKKVKGQNIYKQDKNKKQYTVYAYDGATKRIDCSGDENFTKGVRMKPAPSGDEFVSLYDPSSYIFKIFNSDVEEDGEDNQNEGNNASSDGIKMRVSGIIQTNLEGFNKIRLYRASESTATYRLCATLENQTQTYIDNTQESELTTEMDFAHSAPNPVRFIASRNARFALAGTNVPNFTANIFKGSCVGVEANSGNAFAKKNVAYSSYDYSASVIHTSPMVGVNLSENAKLEATLLNEGMADSLDLQLLIGKPSNSASGMICSIERRLEQSTLDNKVVPFIPNEATRDCLPNYPDDYKPPVHNGSPTEPPWFFTYSVPASLGDDIDFVQFGNVKASMWDWWGYVPSFDPETRIATITLDENGTWKRFPDSTPNRSWKLIVRAGGVEGKVEKAEVDTFYLNPSASSQDTAYNNAVLKIVDADGEPQYFKFGKDITYEGSTRKVSIVQEEGQPPRKLKVNMKYVDLGDDYSVSGTSVATVRNLTWIYEPMVYGIYLPDFQIYYENGTPKYFDGGESHTITPIATANNNAVLLICPIPAIVSNNTIKLVLGGKANARKVDNILSFSLYYAAIRNSFKDDSPIVSYALSDMTFNQRWDYEIRGEILNAEEGKAYATVMPLESNGKPANLYVDFNEDKKPVITAKELRSVIQGYNLIAFDKPNMRDTGSNTFFIKDSALEVQITTAGAGLREKVELADTYNFNDGYGTKIMGIVDCRIGFIIFKDRGVYVLDPDKRVFQCVSHEFGCIASGSIAEGRGGIFWLSNGGRIEYQDFDNGNSVKDIGKGLRPWFDGDEKIGGHSVDWTRIEDETEACFDSDYGDYIISIPTKKDNANSNVILAYNEEYNQWWRIDDSQSHNSVKCAFQFEGRGAFAGGYGIYDFKPDKTAINPWIYESRWRDEGTNDTEKLIKRVKFNNFVSQRTDNPTAEICFYKDQKTTPEPNFVSWNANPYHPFYTNQNKSQVESGCRCYEWKFKMDGQSYIKMKGIDVIVRKKEDVEPELSNAPNLNNEL